MKHLYTLLLAFKIGLCSAQFIGYNTPIEIKDSPKFSANGDLEIVLIKSGLADSLLISPKSSYDFYTIKELSFYKNGTKLSSVKDISPKGVDDKRVYVIPKEQIPATDWEYFEYVITYKAGGVFKSTNVFSYFNSNVKKALTVENGIEVQEIYMYDDDKSNLYLLVRSKHDGVRLDEKESGIKKNALDATMIGKCQEGVLARKGQSYILKMTASEGSNYVANTKYTIILKARKDDTDYFTFSKDMSLAGKSKYKVTKIVGNTVTGHVDTKLVASTSIPGSSLNLIFKDNPLKQGSMKIIGGKQAANDLNQFEFNIESKDFGFGKYEIEFTGASESGEAASFGQKLFFEKQMSKIAAVKVEEKGPGIIISCTLDQKIDKKEIALVIDNVKFGPLYQDTSKPSTYSRTITQSELQDNGLIKADAQSIAIDFEIDGINSLASYIFPLTVLKIEELEKVGTKKKDVVKYLTDNGIQGNLDVMADSIIAELKKSKPERNWSSTWSSIVSVIKPIVGAVMLLI